MGGYCTGLRQVGFKVCVECLIGKQKKPILRVFKVTEPSSVRTSSSRARQNVLSAKMVKG